MNSKKWITLFIILFIPLAFFTGCCLNQPFPPNSDTQIDIRGTILNINPAQVNFTILGTIYVEGSLYEDTFYDKAYISITPSTLIFKIDNRFSSNSQFIPIPFSELQTGMMVEVAFTGPVLESYPVQATAKKIVILDTFAQ
ncbi:MAG: DUF3221 domain-containing protein [Candidatus Atribacteria bacterium]|nr:DUF3221 domain-containing protein [Candidatus Atribacteria bacterium]